MAAVCVATQPQKPRAPQQIKGETGHAHAHTHVHAPLTAGTAHKGGRFAAAGLQRKATEPQQRQQGLNAALCVNEGFQVESCETLRAPAAGIRRQQQGAPQATDSKLAAHQDTPRSLHTHGPAAKCTHHTLTRTRQQPLLTATAAATHTNTLTHCCCCCC